MSSSVSRSVGVGGGMSANAPLFCGASGAGCEDTGAGQDVAGAVAEDEPLARAEVGSGRIAGAAASGLVAGDAGVEEMIAGA